MKTTRLLISGLLVVGLVVGVFYQKPALAQYPTKPITVLVGYVAGGTVDLGARVLSASSQKLLGKPVIIENRPGASGAVAIGELLKAKPDGYTLAFLTFNNLVLAPHIIKVNYSYNNLTPIIGTQNLSQGLCVRSDFPVKTYKELVEYARKKPGMVYGHAGKGGSTYTTMAYIVKKEGLNMRDLPFAGGAQSVTALLGGHIDVLSGSGSQVPFVKDGKFRLLLAYSQKKNESFPDVPTLSDVGLSELPGVSPNAFFAPKGIPENIRKTLEKVFTEATKTKEYREFLERTDAELSYYNGADCEKMLEDQYKKWGFITKEIGLAVR
ncbi:MAG: Bug family tripartite tricarboxylate transporter substrate binding protein [Thermodesulfobacteriota bacterium]